MRCIVLVLFIARVIKKADADCDVVPMTQWAEEATHRTRPLANPLELVIVQHSGAPDISDSATDEECEKAAKAIRNYHLTKIKFDDIGMNFLVCNNGKVYEGAGWQLVGAHTRHYNDKSLGISFIGNYSSMGWMEHHWNIHRNGKERSCAILFSEQSIDWFTFPFLDQEPNSRAIDINVEGEIFVCISFEQ